MLTDKWFVAYFTLVWLSSSVHELMFSERSTLIEWPIALSALGLSVEAQLCDFSPLWVSMCPSRWPFRPNDLSHMVHLCGFSLVWVSMCIVRFPFFKMTFRIFDFCIVSPECEWACAPSGLHLFQMTYRRLCTWIALLQCEWVDVPWDLKVGWRTCCTMCTWKVVFHCGFVGAL